MAEDEKIEAAEAGNENEAEGAEHTHIHDEEEDEEKVRKDWEKAGKVAREISDASRGLVMPGASALDIAESIEKMIAEAGGKPAFPVNISVNDTAAHSTPDLGKEELIGEKDVVKIDLGVHVDGCIGDIAYTIDLSDEQGKLVEASKNALDAAIASMKPGVKVGDVGGIIEEEIRKLGFKPIENLTGHMMRPYMLHAGVEIPNIKTGGGYELQEGDVFAIEPFATDGKGRVKDANEIRIFSLEQPRNVRMRQSRVVMAYIFENYLTLPFAERWLQKKFTSKLLLSTAIKELMNSSVLRTYPILKEVGGGLVSQAELTVVIEKDGARVLTK